ncbi:MAG: hypothetical protein B7X06_01945, partial [Verrucomicrobia bacterium 21-51-4]
PASPADKEDPRAQERQAARMAVQAALLERSPDGPLLIATTLEALFEACEEADVLRNASVALHAAQNYSMRSLAERLGSELGYDSESICEQPGQYAVRGSLIDVYPVQENQPYRLDFFGDTLESIRPFDPTSQRSEGRVDKLLIAPAQAVELTRSRSFLDTYLSDIITQRALPKKSSPGTEKLLGSGLIHWIFVEPSFQGPQTPWKQLVKAWKTAPTQSRVLGLVSADLLESPLGSTSTAPFKVEALEAYRPWPLDMGVGHERNESELEARRNFLQTLAQWANEGQPVECLARHSGELVRMEEWLQATAPKGFRPKVGVGPLLKGIKISWITKNATSSQPDRQPWVLATEYELFGRKPQRLMSLTQRKRLPVRSRLEPIIDFEDLVEGDLLVHAAHGVCRFLGLQTLESQAGAQLVITLEFANAMRLHLPARDAHWLSRYVGLAKASPKLASLKSASWQKTLAAAERSTLDFAAQLVHIQAERDAAPGHAFAEDTPWQKEFEASFPYPLTPDQNREWLAIKADMESSRPMERLLCGDVGFGKTELAMRAAFKAAIGGKQVAMLVPTTVLCEQHFETFRERMCDFPIVVEMLSRFRSPKEQATIRKEMHSGLIDIVIGTHSLLGSQVRFKDLGLIIIDEEHRFGVKDKEALKAHWPHVDILSMSATPIPRTLYMALMGARDLGTLETPPRNRLPIETHIAHYNPKLVERAIRAEIDRGGQVFYLHNRVATIHSVARKLQERIPELKIAVAHGKMGAEELEEQMHAFVAGQYHMLV